MLQSSYRKETLLTHPAGPHHDALVAREYPEGTVDALGANERQRRLGERVRRTVTGKFWGASKPRDDYTFTTGVVGWVATATPLMVHNHPDLARLGNAFSDGANLWVHGPWLEQHAAEKANDPSPLVDWAHLCLHEMAQRAAGLTVSDPLLPMVSDAQLQAALPQGAPATWSPPGDTRPIRQALGLARQWDTGAKTSSWASVLSGGDLDGFTCAGTPAWRSWCELFSEGLPDADELVPEPVDADVLRQVQRENNQVMQDRWTHSVLHALMTLKRHGGRWREGNTLVSLLEVVRATHLGTNSFYTVPCAAQQGMAWPIPTLKSHPFFDEALKNAIKDMDHYLLDGVNVSARDHRPVLLPYGEGMGELFQYCVVANLATGRRVSDALALGNAHQPAWLSHLMPRGMASERLVGMVDVWLEAIEGHTEPLLHLPTRSLQDETLQAHSLLAYVAQHDIEQTWRLIQAGCRTEGLDAHGLFWLCLANTNPQDANLGAPLLAWLSQHDRTVALSHGDWNTSLLDGLFVPEGDYVEGLVALDYLRTQHDAPAQDLLECTAKNVRHERHDDPLSGWLLTLLKQGAQLDLPNANGHTPRSRMQGEPWLNACLRQVESVLAAERLDTLWPQPSPPAKVPRM